MSKAEHQFSQTVEIVDYDPKWAAIYAAECNVLWTKCGTVFVEIEHIGSTAIPNQRAKPIIDIMAAVNELEELEDILGSLVDYGYGLLETGMKDRHFLRRKDMSDQVYHLHVVERRTWAERKERLMRDYLLDHPEAVDAYGELKDRLAQAHIEDSFAYTKAKTEFIQGIVDKARERLGLPPIDVWHD